jgi:phosphatidylcholine synthase
MDSKSHLPLNRKIYAYGVHLFTATGAIWGLLALMAVFKHEWRPAILWMVLAMFVDGFDGMLARWANVKLYAKNIDGALLDNIIDYLNYVVVPALFLVETDLLPAGFKIIGACAVLLTSAYQFTQVDAKTDETQDYFFKGFPCYWNVLMLYMLIMTLNPWVNLAIVVVCNILVFVPIKYIYPSRNTRLRSLTLILSYLYGIVGIWGVMQYPNVPKWVIWGSFIYVAYYTILSLWPRDKNMQAAAG